MRTIVRVLVLVALLGVAGGAATVLAESVNVLANASLEGTYTLGVAEGWTGYDSGGEAAYRFSEENTAELVYDGELSQTLEIDTGELSAAEAERFAGVYQVANVVNGESYMFSLYGLARNTLSEDAEEADGFVVQVGFDLAGGTDPSAVTEWTDLEWQFSPSDAPGEFESYSAGITATSDKATVFVQLAHKLGTPGQLGSVNLDAVSLVGAAAAVAEPAETPAAEGTPAATPEAAAPEVAPTTAAIEAVGSSEAQQAEAPAETALPQTGAGGALPLVGAAAALVMLALAGVRMWGQRSTR